MRRFHRAATLALGVVLVAIGVALVVETALHGGGAGFLFGALFVAAGAGRVFLLLRG